MSPGVPGQADAAVALTITPLTWNVIGLDSNGPATGPNRFPVGARVCVTAGSTENGSVTATFAWDSANANVNLRPGSLSSIDLGSIAPGGCADAYFEVEVTKTAAAFDTVRRYHITATDSGSGATVSTPQPRELYVEHLISQSRNGVTSVKLNGASIPAGGTMTLMVGNTYTIEFAGYTATQGYNQLEGFINFPNTIFRTLAVSTTYSADTSPYVTSPDDKLYADACLWNNDPNNPNYRSCVGGDGKAGGTVVTTYTVTIIGGAGTSQSLSSLLYDFSGSSYHYNADYTVSSRIAQVVGPESVTIAKSFTPRAIAPGGTSTLTLNLSNPTPDTFTGVNFADPLPAGMAVAAVPNVTYSGCGAGAFSPTPGAGATSLAFANGTLAPNSVCRITVDVTAPAGTYDNTTGHLFINGTVDTGNVGQDSLTAASVAACVPSQTMARWGVPNGTTANPPDLSGGLPTTKAANVATATAVASVPLSTEIFASSGQGDTTSWKTWGYKNAGQYVQFVVDTSKYSDVSMSFHVANPGGANGPTSLQLSYNAGSGFVPVLTIANPATAFTLHTRSFSGVTSTTGTTTFRLTGSGANNDQTGANLDFDNIVFTGCGVPAPSPSITKSFSPDPIVLGATSTLSFTIANTAVGNQALTGVAVTDVLPDGLTVASASTAACGGTLTTTAASGTIALSGGTLAAGGSCTFSVPVTGAVEGQYDNVTGFVSSAEGGTSTNYATDSLAVIAPADFGKAFSPASVLTGETSTLTFTIDNPNRATSLSGIGFTDNLPAGLTVADGGPTSTCGGSLTTSAPGLISLTGGTLAANSSCSFSVTVTGATAGSHVNTTSAVTSTQGGSGPAATATLVVSDPVAVLDLNKQISTDGTNWFKFVAVPVGADVYYRFTAYNGGDVPFTSITVSDPAPIACTWTGTTYPPLAPGETGYCVTGPIAAVAGLHPNTATATGTHATGTANASPSTASYGTTGLTLAKSATETSFASLGDVLHYEYLVTNSGFAPLLGPVTVADDKATDEACPALTTIGDLDDYLDPDESITCDATYTVQAADVTARFVTNVASASIDGVTSNSDSVTIGQALLVASKTSTTTSITTAGQVVPYSIALTNTSGSALTAITVSDPTCDSGPTYVSGDTNTDSELQPTETWIYTCDRTVTQADLDAGGNLTNVVAADSAETGSITDTLDIPVVQDPGLTLTKTIVSGAVFAAVDDVIEYEYVVVNSGNVTLDGPITLDDDRTTVACPLVVTLDPGASVTCTATDLVTPADLVAGSVTNAATATAAFGAGVLASPTVSVSAFSSGVTPSPAPTLPSTSAAEGEVAVVDGLSLLDAGFAAIVAAAVIAYLARPPRRGVPGRRD